MTLCRVWGWGGRSKVTTNPWTSTCSTNTTEQNSNAVRPQADLGPDKKINKSFTLSIRFWVSNKTNTPGLYFLDQFHVWKTDGNDIVCVSYC